MLDKRSRYLIDGQPFGEGSAMWIASLTGGHILTPLEKESLFLPSSLLPSLPFSLPSLSPLFLSLFLFLSPFFSLSNKVSHNPTWPPTFYAAENYFELLILKSSTSLPSAGVTIVYDYSQFPWSQGQTLGLVHGKQKFSRSCSYFI